MQMQTLRTQGTGGPCPKSNNPVLDELATQLRAARNLDEIMEGVTHVVRNALQADGVTFVLRDEDHCQYAEEDAISPLWKGQRFPLSACVSGWCMLNNRAVAIPDIYSDKRVPTEAYRPTFVKSMAMAPVSRGAPFAAIGVYWSISRIIGEDELSLLQAIADATAVGVTDLGSQRLRDSQPAEDEAAVPQGGRKRFGAAWDELIRTGLPANSPAAYLFAFACVIVAALARELLGRLGLGDQAPFITFYPAVVLAAIVGGGRAALSAIALAALLATVFFVLPNMPAPLPPESAAFAVVMFLASTGLVIYFIERQRRALKRLSDEDALRTTLVRELRHRASNAVAVTEAIVRRTLVDDAEKAKAIATRVRAAIASDDLFAQSGVAARELRQLLREELAPYGLEQVQFEGPLVQLAPRIRSILALAVHEMATNAAKYGALSRVGGSLLVNWTVRDGALKLSWRESGGPPVRAPRRRGYGMTLLTRTVEGAKGDFEVEYRRAGLQAELQLPLAD